MRWAMSSEDDAADIKLCSIFNKLGRGESVALSAEMFESYGTIRFINMFH